MASPTNCRYTETHEYVRPEGRTGVVGITQHAVEQLHDLVYVDLPPVGTAVTAGEKFGEIESVKAVSELISPVSGKVSAINTAVADSPESVSADPYGNGWLVRIDMSDASELDKLMDAAAYDRTLG